MAEDGGTPPTVLAFSVPADPLDPSIATLRYDGLRLAYCRRDALGRLDPSWRAYGVYLLLGRLPHAGDGDCYQVYVGQAEQLASRVLHHVRDHDKDWATHALLIARPADPAFAFNRAEIGWLEGRLHALLDRAHYATVTNKASTGSSGLDETARAALEALVRPITAALRVLGYPTVTADQTGEVAQRARARQTYHGVTVTDLLDAGLLDPGTTLLPTTARYEAEAIVLPDGRLSVEDVVYDTPSAAATRVVGGGARNGWEFWGAASGDGSLVPLKALRAQLGDPTPAE